MCNLTMLKVNKEIAKLSWMMNTMVKPTTLPEPERLTRRLQLVVSPGFLKRLDEWRATQPCVPNQSRAIRKVMEEVFRGKR